MTKTSSKKRGLFSWYFDTNLLVRILVGLILGAIIGIVLGYFPEVAGKFSYYSRFFGDIFIRLLKMIVVPVILFSLITGAASISPDKLGRVGIKTIFFYMASTIFAVLVGLTLATLFEPGSGLDITSSQNIEGKEAHSPPLSQVLLNIVPINPIAALARGEVLPIIFFAIIVGIALAILKESKNTIVAKQANTVFDFCAGCAEIIYVIVKGIMQYAPIGVFVLIATVFSEQGPRVIGPLLFVTLVVYIAFILQMVICYGGLLTLNKLSFWQFIKHANEAIITAFVTRSSSATVPVSIRISNEKLGVPPSISAFALPIGATINMNGTAIYIAICAMFIGYATGHPLNYSQQLTIMLTATLASIGTAGVPGAGALMLIMALESIGLDLKDGSTTAACYAMIFGIDSLLDMGRSSMNVTGDIVGAVLVSKSEKSLDMTHWHSQSPRH